MNRPPFWIASPCEGHRDFVARYAPGPGGAAILLAHWCRWGRAGAGALCRHARALARAAAAATTAYRKALTDAR